jgi:DNA-binding CsgD family transcriptional regulator
MSDRRSAVSPEKIGDFLAAAYDFAAQDRAWLKAVMNAALLLGGWAVAAHAGIYDAFDAETFGTQNGELLNLSEVAGAQILGGLALFTPGFLTRLFRSLVAHFHRDFPSSETGPMRDGMAACGLRDGLSVNGLDPSGKGAFFTLWSPRPIEVSPGERDLFRRLAHHLGAAHRVRRRLRESQPDRPVPDPTEGAEAILDAEYRVVHATGAACSPAARDDLVASAVARDRARAGGADAGESLRGWRPLTRARWTLIDSFETGGGRHIVARENRGAVQGLAALTDRERQAVGYLAMGQSAKESAYALGISEVNVRQLLTQAEVKLGVPSRDELLGHPEIRALRPDGGRDADA